MGRLIDFARRLRDEERAATLVEYTLMILVIAMAGFVSVASFGASVLGLIQEAVTGFQ